MDTQYKAGILNRNDTANNEIFRNAFQHGLASGALSNGGMSTIAIDAMGFVNEVYQLGKNVGTAAGGAAMINAAGVMNNSSTMSQGQSAFKEGGHSLIQSLSIDSLVDLRNNHIGASVGAKVSSSLSLTQSVADAAYGAITNGRILKP